MDHDADQHDDRAIALAMAAHDLLSRPAFRAVQVVYERYRDRRLTTGYRAR